RRTRRRSRRSGAWCRRARGCRGPPWPRCCPPPGGAIPAGSSCPLQDLHEAPALQLRQRAGLLDPDAVADLGLVRLVVDVELLRPHHGLLVERVRLAGGHRDDRRLVHAGGGDDALPHLAGVGPSGGGLVGHQAFSLWVSSASAAAISRARSSVLIRATR